MAHTYKHQWKYKSKEYWRKYPKMYTILEDGSVSYSMPTLKDRSFNPPVYFDNIFSIDDKSKQSTEQELNKKHRIKWKRYLKNHENLQYEKLSVKPDDSAWELW